MGRRLAAQRFFGSTTHGAPTLTLDRLFAERDAGQGSAAAKAAEAVRAERHAGPIAARASKRWS
jgi:hypothetical protein